MNFTERYKELSTTELFRIIENKDDYQTEAVRCAEMEIVNRNLSQEQISTAKNELQKEKESQRNKELKRIKETEKYFSLLNIISSYINPITKKSQKQIIQITALIFGLLLVVRFIKEIDFFILLFEDSSDLDFSIVLFFIPYIYLATMIYKLWKQTKLGWSLLFIYLVYLLVTSISKIIVGINKPHEDLPFDSLFPKIGLYHYFTVVFLTSVLIIYYRSLKIREYFNISKKHWLTILISTTIISIIYILPFLIRSFR